MPPNWDYRTIAELTLIGTAFGQQFVNVHHFQAGTGSESGMTDDGQAIAWANNLLTHWISNAKTAWLGCHSLDYVLNMIKMQVIERPGNFRHKLTATENPLTTANVGAGSTAANATSVAGNLKWRTQVAGKSHRGRTYIGPLSSNWVIGGSIGAGGQTVLNAYGTQMTALYAIGGTYYNTAALTVYSKPYLHGEYSYPTGKGLEKQFVFPDDYKGNATNVMAHQLDTVARSQRRRNLGVGS